MAKDLMDMVSNQDDQLTKQCVHFRSCLCWVWCDPGVERTGDDDDSDDDEEGGDNDEDDNVMRIIMMIILQKVYCCASECDSGQV